MGSTAQQTDATATAAASGSAEGACAGAADLAQCCPFFHEAVELVGRRWTGAILSVLMGGPRRFSEIAQAVPELSDRLLSARMKELEARGIVARRVISGPPLRVEYELSEMGAALRPALAALQEWGQRWLCGPDGG